ncbi:MAG: adenosine deaminase [Muribaculaceae bacterium]|nr:adenosine deaminase [Roseburia sp.]MCM1431186.1 adenosine deaminase [Muribaculaceae bacterium]MCM1492328.1 adenosine deaminase [Muribaculaceae bacterium]
MNHFVAYNMPKIELHCHLDGSMSPEVTGELLRRLGEEYEKEELEELLHAPKDCESLAMYLERFDLPIRCLQTKEGLHAAALDLALSAAAENVKYLEVRFAPSFSLARGLSVGQVLEAVQEGLAEAEEKAGISTGILVCGMRGLDMEENLSMLKNAREFFGCGVVACDLAGDEKAYPTADYADFFMKAKEYGLPYTIHSGECGSRENIKAAIALGAKRIGHGIAMKGDKELIRLCAGRRIGVELCPTSNLQTKALKELSDYPLPEFLEAGVPVSVNTDNRTVSGTTCTDEYLLLSGAGMMNERVSGQIYRDSVEVSFAPEAVKQRLLTYLY